jgi:hypothetical protein
MYTQVASYDLTNLKSRISNISTAVAFAVLSMASMVVFGGQKTYATEPISSCTTTKTVKTTNLETWDFDDTRSAGHYELVDGGLHIWTDTGATGTPDPRKVAGYFATDFALSGVGTQTIADSLDYTATTGTEPGLQLKVDFDGDGTVDGILVGETVYGNTWWLNNTAAEFVKAGAPNNGGGYGSSWYGTLDEWHTAFANAKVKAIGFSLGSGVNGDGVINKISLGCTDYTFDALPARPTAKEQCKNNGWKDGFQTQYKNQGDCVSSVVSNRDKAQSSNSLFDTVRQFFGL